MSSRRLFWGRYRFLLFRETQPFYLWPGYYWVTQNFYLWPGYYWVTRPFYWWPGFYWSDPKFLFVTRFLLRMTRPFFWWPGFYWEWPKFFICDPVSIENDPTFLLMARFLLSELTFLIGFDRKVRSQTKHLRHILKTTYVTIKKKPAHLEKKRVTKKSVWIKAGSYLSLQ